MTIAFDLPSMTAMPNADQAQPAPRPQWRLPPAPETKLDLVRRIGRPLARLGIGVSMVLFGAANACAAWIAAINSLPAPDMSGLLSTMMVLAGVFGVDQVTYSQERKAGVA